MKYLHEHPDWPSFKYDLNELEPVLSIVAHKKGLLVGKLQLLGLDVGEKITVENLSLDLIKSYEIEGEKLNDEKVRSSIARRLGVTYKDVQGDRYVDGVVEMMIDAAKNNTPVTEKRLCGWHNVLFPTGFSGMHRIDVGMYRKEEMEITSGPEGRKKVHYRAPNPERVKGEMDRFLRYFNQEEKNKIIQSAVSHYWFLAIHPFDDGNGRIGRALADMKLFEGDSSKFRYFSLSEQIAMNKKEYQEVLDKTSFGGLDLTKYIKWYAHQVEQALDRSEVRLEKVVKKVLFWKEHHKSGLNDRQTMIINKMFDGEFFGKLTRDKYCKMTKVTANTGFLDIKKMEALGIVSKYPGGGRSTSYFLSDLGPTQEKKLNKGMSL